MFETLRRERVTQVAQWEMTMKLMASGLGVRSESLAPTLARMKDQLERQLNGKAYSASFVKGTLEEKRAEIYKERKLLERLSNLGKPGV